MSVSRVFSASVVGLEGRTVIVETAIGNGFPGLTIVGLPDTAVKESRERVKSALRQLGFPVPGRTVVVNLAPADLPKVGTGLDLPMAISILVANGDLPGQELEETSLAGELALDGALRPIPGALAIAEAARRAGKKQVIVPIENGLEAAAIDGITVTPASHLGAVMAHLAGRELLPPLSPESLSFSEVSADPDSDLRDVRGQMLPKRALEIAAAGAHNILFTGPPGSGKTMLARRMPGILPPLSREETLELTLIWSVAGKLPARTGLLKTRPFRSPHHGASAAALSGGGADPRPGELSLAHFGVLFLDELPEFRRDALETLREPLEEGVVSVARASGARTFPARFLFVGAMNPCPCGYRGDPRRACQCSEKDVARYRRKISGPLLDRIDLHVEVPAVAASDFHATEDAESSATVKERVLKARNVQLARSQDPRKTNSTLSSRALKAHLHMTAHAQQLLEKAMDRLALSARVYQRMLRVSRTIADLAGSPEIEPVHASEALRFRPCATP